MSKPIPHESTSHEEAFIGVLASAVAADGKFVEPEIQLIQLITNYHKFTRNQRRDTSNVMIARVQKNVLDLGPLAALEHYANIIPADWRGTTFLCAVDLVYIDGERHEAEEEFMVRLAALFSVGEDVCKHFRSVFMKKNGIVS